VNETIRPLRQILRGSNSKYNTNHRLFVYGDKYYKMLFFVLRYLCHMGFDWFAPALFKSQNLWSFYRIRELKLKSRAAWSMTMWRMSWPESWTNWRTIYEKSELALLVLRVNWTKIVIRGWLKMAILVKFFILPNVIMFKSNRR